MPAATGAAIAAPDRPVLSPRGRRQRLYTIQALWTMAREKLNVTTVLINNAAYAILRIELARTGAGGAGGPAAGRPDARPVRPGHRLHQAQRGLRGPGPPRHHGGRADRALREAYAEPGPHLIEAIVPPGDPAPSAGAW